MQASGAQKLSDLNEMLFRESDLPLGEVYGQFLGTLMTI
jgi:hypothetical protein